VQWAVGRRVVSVEKGVSPGLSWPRYFKPTNATQVAWSPMTVEKFHISSWYRQQASTTGS